MVFHCISTRKSTKRTKPVCVYSPCLSLMGYIKGTNYPFVLLWHTSNDIYSESNLYTSNMTNLNKKHLF